MGSSLEPGLRRVAIYGRVSTEHEAQLSAFENQQAWYEGIVHQHAEWTIVSRYYDEGITGTAAQKRPEFMRMLADAHDGKFDLIVTREVCRFARNTVDALTVTRDLSRIGVEVYFVQDNIWTMDGDGELRLTIMATLAQEESRKISERVRAGQQISREKGVLYGNGNILGYNLKNGSYIINPEQAFTVRKIFELYASGIGYKRICTELTQLGCKNAHGQVNWKVDRIGRILRNATYKGYIGYNKSHSDGYLTQKRVTHRDEEFIYLKGAFEPIVSEELWQRCADLRAKKSSHLCGEDGKLRKFGRKEPQSVWTSKLRCSCGSSFRRFLWHKNADERKSYGYECYRRKRTASATYLKTHNLDASQICQSKSIPYWHIDMMAVAVFKAVWGDMKDAVLLACQMIEECAVQDTKDATQITERLQAQICKLQQKQQGLRSMRAMGDISREEFLMDNEAAQKEINALQLKVSESISLDEKAQIPVIDLAQIRKTLNEWVDISGPIISEAIISQFVSQVIVVDDNTFNWVLNLGGSDYANCSNKSNQYRSLAQCHVSATFPNHENAIEPKEVLSFTISGDDAKAYCHSIGMKFFGKKWHDKLVVISIA